MWSSGWQYISVTAVNSLLQQLVVGEAEGLLQQDRQHHTKDEEAFLLRSIVLITDLD